ncbi:MULTISPECIES: GIY-YIG nuclease family protein [unclassified Bradyrhizobium]|uniref:GIY-YIG nuclease family protein n=1 Tax=unclassified Bradyrhizobium TaxID=2631580 RepID=UPI001FFB42EC|nr:MULTISPECIES: GIY-YIG nuclease family protein [unclassified Bradyrhizobium]MCK1669739.1 GIY-YIG nuclease family protein [Bradyrhizobium sp. 153]MCK1758796.1 GIY-YIG nuclease family protein [Bradyrhizobium sp. 137]
MELNELLLGKGIDPRGVIVFRHRPKEPELNKVFPLLAADRPDLFNAYQQTHGEKIEKAILSAKHVAAFIRHGSGKALFVGLYEIGRSRPLTQAQYWQVPALAELKKLGMHGYMTGGRPTCLWFDLKWMDFYSDWKGKLIVDWPPPERSWWRRADRNRISVHAVLEDSALDAAMQKWNELDLTWDQLSILPKRWQAKLAEWRGIYYIFDRSDAKGYVGSAYGSENLLGRWRQYGASGHGGNKLLRQRDPKNFRFTILELVSPTMPPEEVQLLEGNWKERLHTRQPYGLNDN